MFCMSLAMSGQYRMMWPFCWQKSHAPSPFPLPPLAPSPKRNLHPDDARSLIPYPKPLPQPTTPTLPSRPRARVLTRSPCRDPTTFVGLLRQYHPYICIVLILFVVGGGEIEQKTGTPLIKGAAMAREFIQISHKVDGSDVRPLPAPPSSVLLSLPSAVF